MIRTWTKGLADEGMPEALLVETLQRVRRHPWWHARAKLALELMKRNRISPPAEVLDAGCGWGVNLEALERAGYRATGLDVSRRILELIDQPTRQLIEGDLTHDLPTAQNAYDAVLALDVIEHLDDDRAAVRRLAELVRPGGALIVSVPALPELFSQFDRIQGHRRRYVPDTLRRAFEGADLTVRTIFWWGAWMVPILKRRQSAAADAPPKSYADYLRLPPWPGPMVLRMLHALEQSRAIEGKLRIGTSLFAVAVHSASTPSAKPQDPLSTRAEPGAVSQ